MDICPTCGHRHYNGARPQGQLTDTRNLVQHELGITTDPARRVLLLQMLSDLQIIASKERTDKYQQSLKKLRVRKQKSMSEKIIKRARIRKLPVGILPQETVDAIRARHPDVVKPDEIAAATEQESLQHFLSNLKPKEEKTNED